MEISELEITAKLNVYHDGVGEGMCFPVFFR